MSVSQACNKLYNDLTGHRAAQTYTSKANTVAGRSNGVDNRILTISNLDKNYIYIAAGWVRLQSAQGYLSTGLHNGSSTFGMECIEAQRGDFYPVASVVAVIPNATTIGIDATQKGNNSATIDANLYIIGIRVY